MTSCRTSMSQNGTEKNSSHSDMEGCETDAEDNDSEAIHFQHVQLHSIQCQLFQLAADEYISLIAIVIVTTQLLFALYRTTPERNRKDLYELSESCSKVTKANTQELIRNQETILTENAKEMRFMSEETSEDLPKVSATKKLILSDDDNGKSKKRRRKVDVKKSSMPGGVVASMECVIDTKIVPEAHTSQNDNKADHKMLEDCDLMQNRKDQSTRLRVVKSGISFQRCSVCFGFGKGLLPPKQSICRHCKRTQSVEKRSKKKSKTKKASIESVDTPHSKEQVVVTAKAKRVSFGKHQALPYAVSVKRLKAHAKKTISTKPKANNE